MIVGLQTSDPICHVWIDDTEYTWEAARTLAHGLLTFLEECMQKLGKSFGDITGIVVFKGPGSFTGLRIGITVMNTIASSNGIPIIGETGDDWLTKARNRLTEGDDDKIVLPEYGGEAHITTPKK